MAFRDDIAKARALFLENPEWKQYYEGADSDALRRYIDLQFYWSSLGDIPTITEKGCDRAYAEADEIEKQFTLTDCEYLMHHCGNSRERRHWQQLAEEKRK